MGRPTTLTYLRLYAEEWRKKTYLQSVELFYGLILLAIVRVYTIEKHWAATPWQQRCRRLLLHLAN